VPAKNSIKTRSFCFGMAVKTGVSLATAAAGVIVEIGSAGLQENATKASTNERNLTLKRILICVLFEKLISVYSVIARTLRVRHKLPKSRRLRSVPVGSNLMAQITRKLVWKRKIASQRTLAMTGLRWKFLIQNSAVY
jgi:hypothetical protein